MKSRPAIGAGLMLVSAGAGCLDILSYRLGEVFPSAMTGNLALLGRSLGEGDAAAALRNACAFAGFFLGVLLGAVLLGEKPGKVRFLGTLAVQAAVLGAFAARWDAHALGAPRLALIGVAALGMGLQSAVALRIGVHAVATTYFTGTTTNIAFGLVSGGSPLPQRVGWPVSALLAYLGGAALAGGLALPRLEFLPLATTAALGLAVAIVRVPPRKPA